MKEYDRVRLIVEKEKYAEDGVHKGMDGWICDPRNIEEMWLVCFDSMPSYATIAVKEKDLELVHSSVDLNFIVQVTNEKEEYVKEGIHKGMEGVLGDPYDVNHWWVEFKENENLSQSKIVKIHRNDLVEVDAIEMQQDKEEE